MATKKNTAKVIDFAADKKKEGLNSEKKWGKNVMDLGFCIFPSLLLKSQGKLGIKAAEMAVLLQIIDHWWHPDRWPYPSNKTLADRLTLSTKSVQRHIKSLEDSGFLKRIPRYGDNNEGRMSNEYDLSGLVDELNKLEPEFTKANKEAAEIKEAVEKIRGKKKKK